MAIFLDHPAVITVWPIMVVRRCIVDRSDPAVVCKFWIFSRAALGRIAWQSPQSCISSLSTAVITNLGDFSNHRALVKAFACPAAFLLVLSILQQMKR